MLSGKAKGIDNFTIRRKLLLSNTHPMEGHWKFLGGVLKAKLLEKMYENKI